MRDRGRDRDDRRDEDMCREDWPGRGRDHESRWEGRRPDPRGGEGCCEGDGCCDGPENLVDSMLHVWREAFECACHEVQVEILKPKIRKAWGKKMEGVADSVVDVMMKDWKSSIGGERAKEEKEKAFKKLVEKITSVYGRSSKR